MKHRWAAPFALTTALALPLALPACGSRKPAATATTPAASSAAAEEAKGAARPGADSTSADAPPPPPAPGESSRLTGAVRSSYDKGMAAYNAGDLPAAQQAFQQAISAEPKAYEAHYAIGLTYEHMGRPTDALEHYREAYKLNPNYEAAIAAYGFLLYKQGSRTEAETFLSDQSAKNPKAIGVMTALAEIKSLQADSSTAQSLAGNALTIEAKYEPAMVLIARDHYRRGRLDLATYVLSAILDGQKTPEEKEKNLPAKTNPPRAPNNAEAHFLRAVILQKQSERLTAAKWYETATKIRPDLVEARLQLGLIRLEANDADGALEQLQRAVAYGPGNIEAHLSLGEAYRLAGGRPADAKREYVWVTSSPGAPAQLKALAQYDLGLLYFLSPGFEGLPDAARYDKAVDQFNQFKTAKGAASGPSWPQDADDLIEQARRAKTAAAAGVGAGAATPKPAAPPAAPAASPMPAKSAGPATSASMAPTPAPAASSAAKLGVAPPPAASSAAPTGAAKVVPPAASAAPASSAKPAPSSSAGKPKDTF